MTDSADGERSDKNLIRAGSESFRPRARLIKTLGAELISNEFIAIQELVKNAYDADATRVTISFEEPLSSGTGAIVVADDGDGMTLETLQKSWMEPATLSKVQRKRSRQGRRLTGEKGIGRFAAARVAAVLELTSLSAENGRRITAKFDWDAFEDPGRYLDEITCEWREDSAADTFPGTKLRLVDLKDDWGRGTGEDFGVAFRRLRGELSRMVSPLVRSDFVIDLVPPVRFAEFGGPVTPPSFLGRPPYWMTGSVDAFGVIDAVYQHVGGDPEDVADKGEKPRVVIPDQGAPRCGPFTFEFRVWDRDRENLEELARDSGARLRDIRRDLDAASGIGIYRDNFRIMLSENADWLRLDLRRVQNPTMRLSNNQVVGVVAISRDGNPGLTDQTNRQGIVDTPEFEDFKFAVKAVLSRLEIRRDQVRRPAVSDTARASGFLARLNINPLREFVASHYAADADLQRLVEEAERSLTQGVGEVKVVLARYRRLATLGQLVDVILHDGRTPVGAITNETQLARRDLERLGDGIPPNGSIRVRLERRFDVISGQAQVLTDLFRRISPFSGRKRGRPLATTMERILSDTVALVRDHLARIGARVELPEGQTPVTIDVSEMQGLFFNLVENSAHWLEHVPKEQRVLRLEVSRSLGEIHVIVSDSGPGVDDEYRDRIFDPYFSTRTDGAGLGLAIAGEIAAEHEGALELVADGPLPGATFRVVLRRGIGGPVV